MSVDDGVSKQFGPQSMSSCPGSSPLNRSLRSWWLASGRFTELHLRNWVHHIRAILCGCSDLLGQKSCRTKVSRIFRIFVPNFAPNFAPNFPRIFRGLFVLRFVGDGEQKKFTKNPRHFSMQNSQANTKKIFTKFFWRAGRVTIWPLTRNKAPRCAISLRRKSLANSDFLCD